MTITNYDITWLRDSESGHWVAGVKFVNEETHRFINIPTKYMSKARSEVYVLKKIAEIQTFVMELLEMEPRRDELIWIITNLINGGT